MFMDAVAAHLFGFSALPRRLRNLPISPPVTSRHASASGTQSCTIRAVAKGRDVAGLRLRCQERS